MSNVAPHSLSRLSSAIACAALLLVASAPTAGAAVLYASPTGSASGDCTSPDPLAAEPPCTLQRAAEDATNDNDEVVVLPGVYNETSEVTIANASVNLHGVAGQPRPQITNTGAGYAVRVAGAGSSVRYLRVDGDAGGLRFSAGGSGDQIIASQSTIFGPGCVVEDVLGDVTLTNSVCRGDADGAGLLFQALVNVGTRTLTLRNVTALTPDGTTGGGIILYAQASSNITLDARNVIAEGDVNDVSAGTSGGGIAAANLSFSNYATRLETGGTVTDPATNSNQMSAPVFADADLHQAASSPTINAGTAVGLLGAADVDGESRTMGAAPDIGADEFPQAAAVPAAPSNVFTLGKLDGKKLTLDLPSAGTVDVTDAGAQASAGSASAAAKRFLKPSSASGGPGTVTVTLKLTKAGKQKLRLKGKVRVNARITFTPSGGTAASQTTKLKIKRK